MRTKHASSNWPTWRNRTHLRSVTQIVSMHSMKYKRIRHVLISLRELSQWIIMRILRSSTIHLYRVHQIAGRSVPSYPTWASKNVRSAVGDSCTDAAISFIRVTKAGNHATDIHRITGDKRLQGTRVRANARQNGAPKIMRNSLHWCLQRQAHLIENMHALGLARFRMIRAKAVLFVAFAVCVRLIDNFIWAFHWMCKPRAYWLRLRWLRFLLLPMQAIYLAYFACCRALYTAHARV